jgi:hypothetical protein
MFTVYCVNAKGAFLTEGKAYQVHRYWEEHPATGTEAIMLKDDGGKYNAFVATRFSGQPPAKEVPAKRSTDPTTSKKPKRLTILEERVLVALQSYGNATGKELAAWSLLPLNTVTPRLAPLVRKGKIKDSGDRRDRQIVWVLA